VSPEPGLVKALVGVHALVVEADADAREVLGSVLTYCGALVSLAATAREALDVIRAGSIDVVVVDLGLPGEDAYRLVRDLAARSGPCRPTPAVALGSHRDEAPDRAPGAGFQGHLRTPVDPWALVRMVAGLTRKA
jgi:CheY-like chemotaxis protein